MTDMPTSPTTALVEASRKLPAPRVRASSRRLAVTATFVSYVPTGSSRDLRTDVIAARWKMASVPGLTARAATDGSRRSPMTGWTPGSVGSRRSATVTSAPVPSSALTSRRPMNPEPPVTSTREGCSAVISSPHPIHDKFVFHPGSTGFQQAVLPGRVKLPGTTGLREPWVILGIVRTVAVLHRGIRPFAGTESTGARWSGRALAVMPRVLSQGYTAGRVVSVAAGCGCDHSEVAVGAMVAA